MRTVQPPAIFIADKRLFVAIAFMAPHMAPNKSSLRTIDKDGRRKVHDDELGTANSNGVSVGR